MKNINIIRSLGVAIIISTAVTTYAQAGDVGGLWAKNCASCHGKDGKGETKMGKKLSVKDYTDAKVQDSLKDDVALKTIKEGVKDEAGKEKMKPYAEILSEEEMKGLVEYIRAFKAK
jgi:mono/diheme cytochrome c family protein